MKVVSFQFFIFFVSLADTFPSDKSRQRRDGDRRSSSSKITFLDEDGQLALLSSDNYHDRQGRSPHTNYVSPPQHQQHRQVLQVVLNADTGRNNRDVIDRPDIGVSVSTYAPDVSGKSVLIGHHNYGIKLSHNNSSHKYKPESRVIDESQVYNMFTTARPRERTYQVKKSVADSSYNLVTTRDWRTTTPAPYYDGYTRSVFNQAHLKIVNRPKGTTVRRGVHDSTSTPMWILNTRPPRNTTTTTTERPREKPGTGEIVFPTVIKYEKPGLDQGSSETFIPRISPRGPSCAKGSTFCEKVEGEEYPAGYLSTVLKKEAVAYRGLFGNDVVNEGNITQRIDASDENPLCLSREQIVYPKLAKNKDDKWLFVVNQEQYVQGVRVEICLKEGPCSLTESFPLGYRTQCKQKFIYRKMLSINEDGEPMSDSFKLPSCCTCYVRSDTAARMGGLKANLNITPAVKTRRQKT